MPWTTLWKSMGTRFIIAFMLFALSCKGQMDKLEFVSNKQIHTSLSSDYFYTVTESVKIVIVDEKVHINTVVLEIIEVNLIEEVSRIILRLKDIKSNSIMDMVIDFSTEDNVMQVLSIDLINDEVTKVISYLNYYQKL